MQATNPLHEKLVKLEKENSDKSLLIVAYSSLEQTLQKIIDHPEEAQNRCIARNDLAMKTVFSTKGIAAILLELGFQEEDGGTFRFMGGDAGVHALSEPIQVLKSRKESLKPAVESDRVIAELNLRRSPLQKEIDFLHERLAEAEEKFAQHQKLLDIELDSLAQSKAENQQSRIEESTKAIADLERAILRIRQDIEQTNMRIKETEFEYMALMERIAAEEAKKIELNNQLLLKELVDVKKKQEEEDAEAQNKVRVQQLGRMREMKEAEEMRKKMEAEKNLQVKYEEEIRREREFEEIRRRAEQERLMLEIERMKKREVEEKMRREVEEKRRREVEEHEQLRSEMDRRKKAEQVERMRREEEEAVRRAKMEEELAKQRERKLEVEQANKEKQIDQIKMIEELIEKKKAQQEHLQKEIAKLERDRELLSEHTGKL